MLLLIKITILSVIAPFFGVALKRVSTLLVKALWKQKKRKVWIIMTHMMVVVALLSGWLLKISWVNFVSLILGAPIWGYLAMLGAISMAKRNKEV